MPPPIVPSGFGSPDAAGLTSDPGMIVDTYDFGFGSPDTIIGLIDLSTDYGDSGFGSPLWLLDFTADPATVRDDGGTVMTLTALDWPYEGDHTVTLIDGAGTETPCYGLTLGEGEDYYRCIPEARTRLRFASPRLAPGTYTIRVEWLSDTLHTTEVADALEVVYRARFPSVYEVKSRFQPGPFDVGLRVLAGDRPLGA